jgi:DNA (cytosine-5)-methyltransferase 1
MSDLGQSGGRILDVFCGAGGCSMGYYRAGFHVTGVDLKPQPHYPFRLWQDDALHVLDCLARDGHWQHETFDAIHASPPCQANLKGLGAVNRALGRKSSHVDLIGPVRERLRAIGLPYVIENIEGSSLRNAIKLCGSSFGLAVRRHRLFECSFPIIAPPCAHHLQREARFWTSWRPNGEYRQATVVQVYGNAGDMDEWPEAMGIDWMQERREFTEAIPPAYTEHIGGYLMADIRARAAA